AENEVVLDLPLAAIEEETDARVHILVADPTEGRHVPPPARGLSDQVVAPTRERIDARDLRVRVTPAQTHPPRPRGAGSPMSRSVGGVRSPWPDRPGRARRRSRSASERARSLDRARGTSRSDRPGPDWARTSAGGVPRPRAAAPPRPAQPTQRWRAAREGQRPWQTAHPGSGRVV